MAMDKRGDDRGGGYDHDCRDVDDRAGRHRCANALNAREERDCVHGHGCGHHLRESVHVHDERGRRQSYQPNSPSDQDH